MLLLDEPSNGVYPVSRRELWDLLGEFVSDGMGVLVSTPYMDEAERCHRVGLLHEGRLLTEGSPRALVDGLENPVWMIRSPQVGALRALIDEHPAVVASSPAGDRGVPGSGHYAAAKAGVNSLTKPLSVELAPKIRVNGISPGYVPTEVMMTALDMNEEALESMAAKRIPLQRLGTPADMGSTAVYLASAAGSWMSGQTLIVAGGL